MWRPVTAALSAVVSKPTRQRHSAPRSHGREAAGQMCVPGSNCWARRSEKRRNVGGHAVQSPLRCRHTVPIAKLGAPCADAPSLGQLARPRVRPAHLQEPLHSPQAARPAVSRRRASRPRSRRRRHQWPPGARGRTRRMARWWARPDLAGRSVPASGIPCQVQQTGACQTVP